MQPEYRFLLACLRQAIDGETPVESPRTLTDTFSWPRFLALAEQHQVFPLVRLALCTAGSTAPVEVQRWLDERCLTITAHNLSLAAELVDLLDLFRGLGIQAMPFKGPALAAALYGGLSLRQICDLDIVIPRPQISQAVLALKDKGYRLAEPFDTMPEEQLFRVHKDVELVKAGSGIHLELHWSFAEPGFDKEMSALPSPSANATVRVLNREVPVSAPEDLWLLLSLHGLRHRWEGLKWICDLAFLLKRYPGVHWVLALEKAKQLGRERMLLLSVVLGHELTGVALPGVLADRIARDGDLVCLSKQIYERHSQEQAQPAPLSDGAALAHAQFDSFRLLTRDTFRDRLRLVAGFVSERLRPTAEDRRCIALPRFANAGYWLVRPVRVFAVYGPGCVMRSAWQWIRALC